MYLTFSSEIPGDQVKQEQRWILNLLSSLQGSTVVPEGELMLPGNTSRVSLSHNKPHTIVEETHACVLGAMETPRHGYILYDPLTEGSL